MTLAEKRRKLSEDRELKCTDSSDVPSCARTDAKTQNRDIQMRYDIAKNEDGPLRKTMKGREEAGVKGDIDRSTTLEHGLTAEQYPALDERLRNIEAHLSVRYGEFTYSCTDAHL